MEEKPKPRANPIIFKGNLDELIIRTEHKEWLIPDCCFYSSPISDSLHLSNITERDLSEKGYDALIHASVVPVPGPNLRLFYTGLPVKKITSQ